MGNLRNAYGVLVGKIEWDNLEDLDADGIFGKQGESCVLDASGSG
jgi:hypothetical protein